MQRGIGWSHASQWTPSDLSLGIGESSWAAADLACEVETRASHLMAAELSILIDISAMSGCYADEMFDGLSSRVTIARIARIG